MRGVCGNIKYIIIILGDKMKLFKNAAFIVAFILLCIDPETWTFDKSYLAKFYQAIDIIEKDENLKKYFMKNNS